MMVTMTFVYNCVYVTGTHIHFTRSFRCLPAPVPPFDHAHSNSPVGWKRDQKCCRWR